MKRCKLLILSALMAITPLVATAAKKDSDTIQLVIGMKKRFHIGKLPPEIFLQVDPFSGKNGETTLRVPITWDVDKNIKLTMQHTCSKKDEALCNLAYIAAHCPNQSQDMFSGLILDRTQEPVSTIFTGNHNTKVENHGWKFTFHMRGKLNSPIEARTYRSTFTMTVEADV
ncbi:hypothetical protein ACED51_19875 [Photobacterium swingsii]|uniref:hypothetical protein n=1 Tax=Photobacterium swingsii TaxID=680026 RepID=UPI00352E5FDE